MELSEWRHIDCEINLHILSVFTVNFVIIINYLAKKCIYFHLRVSCIEV